MQEGFGDDSRTLRSPTFVPRPVARCTDAKDRFNHTGAEYAQVFTGADNDQKRADGPEVVDGVEIGRELFERRQDPQKRQETRQKIEPFVSGKVLGDYAKAK